MKLKKRPLRRQRKQSKLAPHIITHLCSHPLFIRVYYTAKENYSAKKTFSPHVFSSTENGEKTEKAEPEPEVKEEIPEETEERTVKTKTKKDKKAADDGFELWNELEVQRIKFMVSSSL